MRRYLLFAALITTVAAPIAANSDSARGTSSDEVADAERSACLSSPSALCIFSIATSLARSEADACTRTRNLYIVAIAQAQAGFQKSARELTAEADRVDGCIGLQTSDPELLVLAAGAQFWTGDREGARETVQTAIQATKRTDEWGTKFKAWNSIAEITVSMGDIASATALPQQIDDPLVAHGLLEKMARYHQKTGDTPGTLTIAAAIPDELDRYLLLEELAKAQAEQGNLIAAVRFLEQIVDDRDLVSAMKTIINALATKKDLTAFLTVMNRASRQMADASLRAEALAGITIAYTDVGMLAQAKETLSDVILTANQSDNRDEGRRSISIAQAAVGNLDDAVQTVGKITDQDTKHQAIADLAALQAKVGKSKHAAGLVSNIPVDWFFRDTALEEVAKQHAMTGDIAEAIRTLALIENPLKHSLALADIVEARAATGDFEGALFLASHLERNTPHYNQALRNIAHAQYQAGDSSAAARTLTLNADSPHRTTNDLMGLATMQGVAGDYAAAARTIDRIDDPEWQDLTTLAALLGLRFLDEETFWTFLSIDSAHHLATQIDLAPALRFAERLLDPSKRIVALVVIGSAAAKQHLIDLPYDGRTIARESTHVP